MRRRRLIYTLLFFFGTVLAAVGWIAEWKHLDDLFPLLTHTAIIAGAGHLLQVIGAFGSLVTPDRIFEDV
ncbi:MAG: hypothetical protein Q8902_08100 [Bacteroidota bacterium]|nr:hypothetical protein [Bacteroidota bacterium]MDP4232951.1 hypothetical protein [Bacteroidota bacterium]MDP4241995.1 hypothetical protein [Bacteroidota bacterium]